MNINNLEDVSTLTLIKLAEDANMRIGSHMAGGDWVEEYIHKQERFLDAIQSELMKRKVKVKKN